MKRIAEIERKKSTIGHINAELWKSNDMKDIAKLENAARENNIGSAFFNLDETIFKLK